MPTWLVTRTLKTVVTQEVDAKTATEAVVEADAHWRNWSDSDEEILDETVKKIED